MWNQSNWLNSQTISVFSPLSTAKLRQYWLVREKYYYCNCLVVWTLKDFPNFPDFFQQSFFMLHSVYSETVLVLFRPGHHYLKIRLSCSVNKLWTKKQQCTASLFSLNWTKLQVWKLEVHLNIKGIVRRGKKMGSQNNRNAYSRHKRFSVLVHPPRCNMRQASQ